MKSKLWKTASVLVVVITLLATGCGAAPEPETVVEKVVETVVVMEEIVETVDVMEEVIKEVVATPTAAPAAPTRVE
jgi:hypothetical protein